MATVTPKLTISSSDLLSQPVNISVSSSITATAGGVERRLTAQTAVNANALLLFTASDFSAPAYLFVKNTETTLTNFVYVYGSTPSVTLSGGAYNNDPTITHTAKAGIQVGMVVSGDGIPEGSTVVSITSSTEFELSASTTGGSLTGKALVLSYGNPVILKLAGGQFAWMPLDAGLTLKAYGTSAASIVEFGLFGTDA